MNSRWMLSAIIIGAVVGVVAACSVKSAIPSAKPEKKFCSVGYLIRPGEVMDSNLIIFDSKTGIPITTMVLRAGDSVCVPHNPHPRPPKLSNPDPEPGPATFFDEKIVPHVQT